MAQRCGYGIAAETMFSECASANALLEVVADVRASGDVETVLEVLSVAHNPLPPRPWAG
jgi:hypothetical protein